MPHDLSVHQAWHAADVADVVAELDTDLEHGLSSEQAQERLRIHGPNELARDEPRSWFAILLAQFTSPLITILLVALVVTLLIDEYADAGVIAAVLVINATIGFVQERRAEMSVHALMELAAPQSSVVRDDTERDLEARALVPGDVVLLTSGTRVPADLRLAQAVTLDVDESLLTGESTPVRKSTHPLDHDLLAADRTNIAFMGSVVASGRGVGVVVATAGATQLGGIAESIRQQERPETPLQARMRRFANVIAAAVVASTVVAFFLGLALGGRADEMFLTAVALAVAVVPEGLPVALTVALALGVRRMAQRRAIIRSLPAVETLGSTDVIGSDKTGTLTANRMTVIDAWTPAGWARFATQIDDERAYADASDVVRDDPEGPLHAALLSAVLANEASLRVEDDEIVDRRGDPTETALLEAAHVVGMKPMRARRVATILASVPFESSLRYALSVVDEDGPVLRLKGAPERVVELCDQMRGSDAVERLDTDEVMQAAEQLASRGLRVLATAEVRLDVAADKIDPERPPTPAGLVLTGLLGLQDPPREGVVEAVKRCRSAGIRVVMITGDHAATARAIAAEVGIDERGGRVLTGNDLERIDDEELAGSVQDVDVYARVAPDHKLRVVRALQSHGQVVAVTGDGVNDGPALKAADIGVAMGRSGTDVAREASDMVLTDDAFVSIANAVEEGRVVFDNVRKVTYFLISTGVAAIVAILTSIIAGLPLPYTPAALLWLNVVTNGLQDVALAFDRAEPDVLDRPPRRREEGIVSPVLWERAAVTGVTMAVGSLWVYLWARDVGLDAASQRGAALSALVMAMAVHAYNARSERRSIVTTHVRGNLFLLVSTVIATSLHVAALHVAATQTVLQIGPVPAGGWLRIGVVALAVVAVSELHKWLRSRLPAMRGQEAATARQEVVR